MPLFNLKGTGYWKIPVGPAGNGQNLWQEYVNIPFELINAEFEPIELKIKLLTNTAKMPTKVHDTDACFDIYADLLEGNENGATSKMIMPHETVMIPTGFATAIPTGWWAPIYARSGVATKRGLRLAQGTAVIDSDYRGQWFIPLHLDFDKPQIIEHGERICQFHLQTNYPTALIQVEDLDETERGEGGFSSSGKF